MWPSLFVDSLSQRVLHRRAHEIAKNILGDDMAFDFDMLIAKVMLVKICFLNSYDTARKYSS